MLGSLLVAKFMKMLANQNLTGTDASRLAEALGSREEFLAHLIVKTDFLRLHSEVRAALKAIATESGYEALTKRDIDGPLAAARNSVVELSGVLRSLVEADKGSTTSYEKLANLDQQMLRSAVVNGRAEASPERWIKRNPQT